MIAQGWSRDVTQVHGPGDKASRKRDHQLKKNRDTQLSGFKNTPSTAKNAVIMGCKIKAIVMVLCEY